MKKLYTLGIALSMVAFGTQSIAQVQVPSIERASTNQAVKAHSLEGSSLTRTATTKKTTPTPKDGEIVYFSEDFSNGLGGQLDVENGAWTVGDTLGSLWFQTYPVGEPNGYDPDAAILGGTDPEYGTNLPLLFEGDVVNSPTRNNGVMMIDADRWNSHSTVENPLTWPPGEGETQDDYIAANIIRATLTSPPIDLSGVEGAYLTFYHGGRINVEDADLYVEVSVDGQGASWTSHNVYNAQQFEPFSSQVGVNISSSLQEEGADLENVYVRFNWGGQDFRYFYWTVDDLSIVALPNNDLAAGVTYTNNWEVILPMATVDEEGSSYDLSEMNFAEYINASEYSIRPQYYSHMYNFGMEVSNNGGSTQADVKLVVVATAPDGTTTHSWTSDPIELEAGAVDTIWINGADLSEFPSGTVNSGTYTFNFEVIQEGVDEYPDDNIGVPRTSGYTSEAGNQGYAIFQNGSNSGYVVYSSSYNVANGHDMTNATGYVFPELETGYEPKFITHVEVALIGDITLNNAEQTNLVTTPGNEVYFNVRKNHPSDAIEGDEASQSVMLFGTDDEKYVGTDIVYTIAPEDLSSSGSSYTWTSFELPTPVAIEPGVVYMAEIRVPSIGNERVFLWGYADAPFVAYNIYFAQGVDGTATLGGGVAPALRFRTANGPDGIEKISVESGLTLIQNYPNPFTDVTRIQYMVDKSSKVNFEVRDLTGKLVYTKDLGNIPANAPQTFELQKGNLAAGMYTYTIATSEFQVTRKLTVQ